MAGNRLEREIPAELAGKRLDQALAQLVPEQSRSFLQKLIREGKVRAADGSVLDQVRQPVRAGQLLVLELPEPVSGRPAPKMPGRTVHAGGMQFRVAQHTILHADHFGEERLDHRNGR